MRAVTSKASGTGSCCPKVEEETIFLRLTKGRECGFARVEEFGGS